MTNDSTYKLFPNFVLRAPLLPYHRLEKLLSDKTETNELKICINELEIQEAIYLASPDLYYELKKWTRGELKDNKKTEKLKLSFLRYLLRMSTRCTPFGLFAGFAIGTWNDITLINLGNTSSHHTHVRLDMNYLCALAQNLSKYPTIFHKLQYSSNTSLYAVGDKFRFVEYFYSDSKRFHRISAVDNSYYLNKIIDITKTAVNYSTILNCLLEDNINHEEANGFIKELINNQILTSSLEPSITGPEFLNQLLSIINNIEDADNIKQILILLKKQIEALNSLPVGKTIDTYEKFANTLKQLDTKYEKKFLFQADLTLNTNSCQLGKNIKHEILSGLSILNKLTPENQKTNLDLFKESFYKRYEDNEVSLLTTLDSETGIGYIQNGETNDANILVDDLLFLNPQPKTKEVQLSQQTRFLLRLLQNNKHNYRKSINLSAADIKEFNTDWENLPDTMSAVIKIIKNNDDNQDLIFFNSASGSSAANLLGRFCHADGKIHDHVKAIIQKEDQLKDSDTIIAEIVHLPESRTGNILMRPTLREFEISYLAKHSVEEEFHIPLSDLYLSIRNQQIILRSKKLNKRIIPRMSNAHNYSGNTLPIYQFLCELQTQNLRPNLFFDWGEIINDFDYLPRITSGHIILSLAQWNFNKSDLEYIIKEKNKTKKMAMFKEWRCSREIDKQIVFVEFDNELFLDLENENCIEILLKLIKNRPTFTLKETLFNSDNLLVNGEQGSYTNEFIVSFYKSNKKTKPQHIISNN
ncbi:MAG: lantibiotic dehydratase family protein [Bacteroidales bacterium]|nr:lantibiotic dehydratase family protein [Bacteroidales bacterium]